jgi:hypothetical protein|tara:strand:- start:14448 stop:14903 length:456 start_codon:yes stop_codon:yes gene_type:complete
MSDITLITAPDLIHNKNYSFLLIQPSNKLKEDINNLFGKAETQPFNVYLFERQYTEVPPLESSNVKEPQYMEQPLDTNWLLDAFAIADCVILDIDNLDSEIGELVSYFISYSKTFWLTNGGKMYYNKLSANRIYDLQKIKEKLGGQFEATK